MTDAIYLVPDSAGGEFRLHVNGANLELYRDNVVVDSRPLASLTSYTINGGDGGETLRIDELIALPGGIFFNAGAPNSPPGDGIVIALGALDGSTVSYTNATDGVITLVSGAAVATYRFTGVDPIEMTGSTVGNLVFNLPGSTDTRLEDNGNPVDGNSQLRDADGSPGFDTTTFAHPASSLIIHGTAGDSVTVGLVEALGSADLTIGSLTNAAVRPDSISVNNVVTTGVVNLAATGAIAELGPDAGADITAHEVALLAGDGIGVFDAIETMVSTLAAVNTGMDRIFIRNLGDLDIGTVDGVAGIASTNTIIVRGAGNLTVNSNVTNSAGVIDLVAVGPGNTFTNNAAVSAAGFQAILEGDRMALAAGTISAGNLVRLNANTSGVAINLGSPTDVAAGTLELSDAELDTIAAPVLEISGGATGNVTVSNPITANGHYGALALLSGSTIVDGTASEQADLVVAALHLVGFAGIGASDDLNTAVATLQFVNSAGAVNISNSGPLTIGSVAGGTFCANLGTTTTVSATSPLTVAMNVTSGGDLALTAGDSAASGDTLSILASLTVQSTAGSVFLSAGDDFVLGSGASIFSAGDIRIAVDAGNADPGVGGTADIRNGTLTAGSISLIGQGDGDTLLGGAAGENFFGGGGDDLIAGGGGNNALDGGADNDTADYSAAPGAVVIDVATGSSNGYGGTDAFGGIESANGSAFADTLIGDGNANTFKGNGGNDVLSGGVGSDTAAYSGNAADYGLIFLPGTDMRVVDLRAGSPDGTDALGAFEALRFADGTMPIVFGNLVDDDSFTAPHGFQAINARTGNDTITFDFRLVDATVTYYGNSVAIDGPSGRTVLHGFERFVFTDGVVDNNDGDRLVDDLFYYSRNHDVWNAQADADQHYHGSGWHELRDPNAFFSTFLYRAAYPDVSAAGVDPLVHFDQTGWIEGRVPSLAFDPRQYLAANSDVAAAHVDPLLHYLAFGYQEGREPFAPAELIGANGFDYVWYLNHNPDVAAAHVDPLQHFQTFGWQEGRNPNALFDTAGYLATYTDVAAAGVDPLEHYSTFGWREGRDPSVNFDTASYLAAYADVAAAGVDPLAHYLAFGVHEGRSAFADGTWG